jgi:hypothetical protein
MFWTLYEIASSQLCTIECNEGMAMNTTLGLYGAQTGNCIRAAIALEEAGLSYTPKLVDLSSGAHKGVDHLALNQAESPGARRKRRRPGALQRKRNLGEF